MSTGWKKVDLRGGGLQAANLRLASKLKHRRDAYLRLAPFPLGLHRSYLADPRGAWAYRAASVIIVALTAAGWTTAALLAGIALTLAALYDAIRWIERRLVELNKQARIDAWLGHGATPPAGYRGRHVHDALADYLARKAAEPPSAQPASGTPAPDAPSYPSIAEQERALARQATQEPDPG